MAIEVDIDVSELVKKMDATPKAVGQSAQTAMKSIARDWKQQARDVAPIDTGSLRRDIEEKLNVGNGANIVVEMSSNTYNSGFNYAYYQHEVNGRKYLDTTAERNTGKWGEYIEKEIAKGVKKAGW